MTSFFIHESSKLDEGATIGDGTTIERFSHIMARSTIGRNCTIGQNVVIFSDCIIGNNVTVNENVSIYTGVTIEDGVYIGPSVAFTNISCPRSQIEHAQEIVPTRVKNGASIGANATIICGVTLNSYCLIGAGSVVTRDVPDFGLSYGNPARLHGWICKCGEQLKKLKGNLYFCPKCGERYVLIEDNLVSVGKDYS